MKKVSVIVAAYNVEKYIEDTLHSLVNQTMEDAEFIIVDDCSTDKTGEIIKSYSDFDNRIKYIKHAENQGPMLVRKTGVEAATGEYIMFLDGDDTFNSKACEIAYKAIKKDRVDILQFKTKLFSDDPLTSEDNITIKFIYKYLESPETKIFAPNKAGLLGNKKYQNKINFSVWNKIFKKNVIDKAIKELPDKKLYISEDVLFSYLVCFYAHSYSYTKEVLHNYRFGSGISTTNKISESKMQKLAESYYAYTFLKEWTEKQGCTKECESRLELCRGQITSFIFEKFVAQTPKSKAKLYIEMLLKHCPIDDFLTALCSMLYKSQKVYSDKLADLFTGAEFLNTTKKEVKTIATFYFRMCNGGVENVLSQLTDIWVKSGYKVILFTDKEPDEKDYYINPNVTRIILPEEEPDKFYSYEKRIKALRKYLTEYSVDLMVYHAWTNPSMMCDLLTVKSLGIPFVVHTHNLFCLDSIVNNQDGAYFNITLHKIYKLCDAIVTLTDIDQTFWETIGVKAIKTVNPIAFPADVKESDLTGKNIVMVSRLSHEKKILDGVKIIEKVVKKIPDATLTIVGDGDNEYYVNSIKNYIKQNELDKIVKMVGFKKDVIPYYQAADIMLITSKFEGFCLSLVESKLCGLPLVTYNLANLDTVREAKGMAVVPQDDIDAAAEEIIKILSDDKLKKQMGKEARESGEKIISFDIAKQWDYIFEQALIPHDSAAQTSDINTALKILLDFTAEGIAARGDSASTGTPEQIANLTATIKEIRSSTSYRLGWFLTTIPRKIKDKIKGQKYVE